jgi:hypothetical protein
MARIKKVTVDGVSTYTEEATTLIEDGMDMLLMPTKLLVAEPDTFYSPRTAAGAAVLFGIGGIALGSRKPNLPLVGVKELA